MELPVRLIAEQTPAEKGSTPKGTEFAPLSEYLFFSSKGNKINLDKVTSLESVSIPLRLIVLGFNDTSTLVGHFVSYPRVREKRDRRDSRGDEREGQERKRNSNESEETEEIKTFSLYPYLLQG